VEWLRTPEGESLGNKRPAVKGVINVSATHRIRVIYKEEQATIRVIPFYPGRRERYED
jgi:hypothetical protein